MKTTLKNRYLVATAIAGVMAVACSPVMAQDGGDAAVPDEGSSGPGGGIDADQADNEIVVSAIRASLQDALNDKRDADFILDAVSADDFGDLPDLSAGDALVRLPGITGGAGIGDPESLSVRGFSSEFGQTTFNGRVLTSDRSGRNVRTNLFPSALLSRVAVIKTPTASMVEGGVSGTVELSTADPLRATRRDKTIVRANARYEYDESAEDLDGFDPNGYRFDLTVRQSLIDDVLAIGIGFARAESTSGDEEIGGRRPVLDGAEIRDGFTPVTTPSGQLIFDRDRVNDTDAIFDNNSAIITPGIVEYSLGATEDTRTAGVFLATFKPTPTLTFKLDTLIGREQLYNQEARTQLSFFGDAISGTVDDSGYVDNVLFDNPRNDSFSRDREEETKTFTIGLNSEWANDGWTVASDLFYSNVTLDRLTSDATIRPGDARPAFFLSTDQPFGAIGVEFLDYDPANPDELILRQLTSDRTRREDEAYSARLDISRELDFGPVRSIEFGGRFERRRKFEGVDESRFDESDVEDIFTSDVLEANRIPFISSDPFSRFGDDVPLLREWPFFSPFALLSGPLAGLTPPNDRADTDALATSSVVEKTYAGYAMLNLRDRWAGIPVRGNIGLRVVHTDFVTFGSTGTFQVTQLDNGSLDFSVDNSTIEAFSESNSFTNWLPSLNLSFSLADDLVLRFGAAKTIARPGFDVLFPSRRLGVEQELDDEGNADGPQILTVTGGNSFVEPYKANNLDLSLEWSPNRDTLIAVAGFYKDLSTIITEGVQVSSTIQTDIGEQPLRLNTFGNTNPPKSTVLGLEIQGQTVFTFLPKPFDGLGVQLNYSFIDSKITEVVNDASLYTSFNADGTISGFIEDERDNETGALGGVRQPFADVSRHLVNFTMFYEKGPLGLRGALRYRSAGYERDPLASNNLRTEDSTTLDVNARYDLTDNIRLVAQVRNVTNETSRSYYFQQTPIDDPIATAGATNLDADNRLRSLSFGGRTVLVGANFRF